MIVGDLNPEKLDRFGQSFPLVSQGREEWRRTKASKFTHVQTAFIVEAGLGWDAGGRYLPQGGSKNVSGAMSVPYHLFNRVRG